MSNASARLRARRIGKTWSTVLNVASAFVTVGVSAWTWLSPKGDWVPAALTIVLLILVFISGRETGRAMATLAQRRRWEEIEHRGVVWGWGTRVPGEVRGPYCPTHSCVLQECGTKRNDDDVVVRAAAPLCCANEPTEQFGLEIGVGESLSLRDLRSEVRDLLEATEE